MKAIFQRYRMGSSDNTEVSSIDDTDYCGFFIFGALLPRGELARQQSCANTSSVAIAVTSYDERFSLSGVSHIRFTIRGDSRRHAPKSLAAFSRDIAMISRKAAESLGDRQAHDISAPPGGTPPTRDSCALIHDSLFPRALLH